MLTVLKTLRFARLEATGSTILEQNSIACMWALIMSSEPHLSVTSLQFPAAVYSRYTGCPCNARARESLSIQPQGRRPQPPQQCISDGSDPMISISRRGGRQRLQCTGVQGKFLAVRRPKRVSPLISSDWRVPMHPRAIRGTGSAGVRTAYRNVEGNAPSGHNRRRTLCAL